MAEIVVNLVFYSGQTWSNYRPIHTFAESKQYSIVAKSAPGNFCWHFLGGKPWKTIPWPATVESQKRRRSLWNMSFLGQGSDGSEFTFCSLANSIKHRIWLCLKMGYTPNYSHLVGIMIINHWVIGYTIFRQTHIQYHLDPKFPCEVSCAGVRKSFLLILD